MQSSLRLSHKWHEKWKHYLYHELQGNIWIFDKNYSDVCVYVRIYRIGAFKNILEPLSYSLISLYFNFRSLKCWPFNTCFDNCCWFDQLCVCLLCWDTNLRIKCILFRIWWPSCFFLPSTNNWFSIFSTGLVWVLFLYDSRLFTIANRYQPVKIT